MKMTLEMNLHDTPNPEHFQNFLGYARLLDRDAVNGLSGTVPKGLPAAPLTVAESSTDEADLSTDTSGSTTESGATAIKRRGRPPGSKGATAEQATAALEGHATNGALPPGVTPQQSQPVAEASALPPGVGPQQTQPVAEASALPPGVQPQVAAMPVVPPAAEGDGITVADVQACYADFAKRSASAAFGFLKSEKWADGTARPKWLAVSQIQPEHLERVMMELSAL